MSSSNGNTPGIRRGGDDVRHLQGRQGSEGRRLHRQGAFDMPTPFWALASSGRRAVIIPKHLFADLHGAKSRERRPTSSRSAPPVKFKDSSRATCDGRVNANYHMPNRPLLRQLRDEGGGARFRRRGRAADGEYDSPWNSRSRTRSSSSWRRPARGRVEISPGGNIGHIQLNTTDPWTEIDGERSGSAPRHPRCRIGPSARP